MSRLYTLLEDQLQDPSPSEQSQNDSQNSQQNTNQAQQDPIAQYDIITRRVIFNQLKDTKNILLNTKETDNQNVFEVIQFIQIILDYYQLFDTNTLMGIVANITTELEKNNKK